MKRTISALLVALLILTLAACSNQPVEPSDPSSTPQESSEPPETPPAREPYAAMDIFSDEFNPYGMDSPATVFEASFNKSPDNAQFVLSMTGSGNMYACVAYQADVAGLGLNDDGKMGLLEEYVANDGFLEFTGKDGQIVTIRRANPDDDRYEYVESDGSHGISGAGCVIDITYFIDGADIEKYTQLVRDNYSADALMPIADFFNINADFAECGLGVNVHKDEARAYVVYRLPDVNAVMQEMQGSGDAPWWEWNGMTQTAFMYDNVESKLTFDTEGGAITVEQLQTEISKPPAAEGSLAAMGFGFDELGLMGVYEEHEPHYSSIAIHRPEWGEFSNWDIELMDTDVGGYSLMLWYTAAENRWHVALDKNGTGVSYEYTPGGEFGDCHPDPDTVREVFNNALGTQGDGFYDASLAHFEQYVQEHFGMSVDELYAAPKQ